MLIQKGDEFLSYLYYIQRCCEPIIQEFWQRIPESRMEGENGKIKRICLASTIEGCVNAAPWGYSQISYRNANEVFRLYSFDMSKIPSKNIIGSRTLYTSGYVDDAKFTKEVWVLNQNLTPDSIEYFKIGECFEEETVDIISYPELKKCKLMGEYPINDSYFRMVKNLDIQMVKECDLFQGKELKITDDLQIELVDDVIPKEVEFEIYGDFIVFSEPIVFCLNDVKREV